MRSENVEIGDKITKMPPIFAVERIFPSFFFGNYIFLRTFAAIILKTTL